MPSNIIGTGPNQVPTNADLGTMAFQDSKSVKVTDITFTGNIYKDGAVFSGGAKGGGTDAVFYENDQTVTTNYTIGTGKNAGTFGPVTINSGVSVTVPSGSVWTIV